jgi:hypothetical protein
VQKHRRKIADIYCSKTKKRKTLIVLTFAWKVRENPRINLIFPDFEKLRVTNQSTVPLGGNNYVINKSGQPL